MCVFLAGIKLDKGQYIPFSHVRYEEVLQPRLDVDFLKLGNKAYTAEVKARL